MLRFVPIAFALALPASGQGFELSEVLPAPPVGDPLVELVNDGAIPLDTASVRLVVGVDDEPLPSAVVAPGGFVRIHVGVAGVDTPTDLFVPGLTQPALAADSVALYVEPGGPPPAGYLDDPANLVDFVQWGAPDQPFADVAQDANEWFFASTFVPAPFAGASVAWDGAGSASLDWFRDASPTLGGVNVQPSAALSKFGNQCSAFAAGPMLDAVSPPALGNVDFRIDFWTQSLNQPAILFFGTSTVTVPIFGGTCDFYVGGLFGQLAFVSPPSGMATFPVPVPDVPALLGQRFVVQVGVDNGFGPPFAPPADLSSALVIDV